MLKVNNLSKIYNKTIALNNVSFDVNEGEITGFLGPNGAGKTTALRILTGFLEPTSGKVEYDSKPLNSNWKMIISKIGYLPEDNPLYKEARVDDFLMFCKKIKRGNSQQLKSIVEDCGLESELTKRIGDLSKGYRQRVGLAKAMIGDPKYLLLDEPTTGLDPNQRQEILNLIKSLSEDRIVLFSSHNLSEVSQIADRVIIINEGKIVADGKAKDLANKYFKGNVILIKTDAPFEKLKKSLERISGIIGIKQITRGKRFNEYELNCEESDKASLDIFNLVVKNDWKLTQLFTKSMGLEEVFRKLTRLDSTSG